MAMKIPPSMGRPREHPRGAMGTSLRAGLQFPGSGMWG